MKYNNLLLASENPKSFTFNRKMILGRGSNGTIVFDGTFKYRDVAIKRMVIEYVFVGENEAKLLVKVDEHKNIVNYYCNEITASFYWIVMEKCEHNLRVFFENSTLQEQFEIKDILKQIMKGVQYLHEKDIGEYF